MTVLFIGNKVSYRELTDVERQQLEMSLFTCAAMTHVVFLGI